MEFHFAGRVIEWRGPSPYYYVPVPEEESADIREVAAMASYDWGVVPVVAQIGGMEFETSLFPKDGGNLLPLKDAVRKPQTITDGDEISVQMSLQFKRSLPPEQSPAALMSGFADTMNCVALPLVAGTGTRGGCATLASG